MSLPPSVAARVEALVGGHVRDPDISPLAGPVFGTDLHTLGEIGKQGRIEGARSERVIHVVFEPADRHARGVFHPDHMEALRPGREHERHESLRLGHGVATRTPRSGERRRRDTRALEAEQRAGLARRHPEPLVRVAVEAAEAEVEVVRPRRNSRWRPARPASQHGVRWLCYLEIHQRLDHFRHIAAGKASLMGHIRAVA